MKKALLILSILIFNSIFSQQNIDSLYVRYFEAKREFSYLHINKTTFLPGEEIWFKAYILNHKTKKLSNFTRNLHCYIYDENSKIIKKKLLFVESGVANGSFKIDSTFTNQSYYLAASTNWMQNFKEDESFSQKITIINKNNSNIISDNDLDIQILPEGGHHIESSINTFGFIIKDKNNIGIKVNSIQLKDNKNNLLKTFSTNNFGLAKFNFFYEPDKEYHLKIDLGEKQFIEKKIPKATNIGLSLNIENLISSYFLININTNKKSLRNIKDKKFKLFIHNTNSFLRKEVVFENNKTNINILVPKKKLDKGVNIITLFDKNKYPIAERLIYIHDKNFKQKIDIEKQKIYNDSLEIKLSKKGLDSVKYLMSASVLPINTKSYNPKNTIISKFLLMPYIKGHIQNPSYYFNNIDRKKLFDLDLLLLTQGWSKYNWKNIFHETPVLNAISENGINLKGTLNMDKLGDNSIIFLLSSDNKLMLTKEIENNKFKFYNLYLKNNSDVNFVVSTKNKNRKTKGYFQEIFQSQNFRTKTYNNNFEFKSLENQNVINDFVKNDIIQLDPIKLKAKKKPKNNPMSFGFNEVFLLDKNYKGTQDLSDFFSQRGFLIRNNNYNRSIYKRNRQVPIFWDDLRMDEDQDIVLNMRVDEFSEIHYSSNGIFLYTNYDIHISRPNKNFNKIKIKNGFTEPKAYYQPKYSITTSEIFKEYGAIFWKPNLNIVDQQIKFKIPILNQKRFTIYIEGFTASGKYIYEKKNIYLNTEN